MGPNDAVIRNGIIHRCETVFVNYKACISLTGPHSEAIYNDFEDMDVFA